LNLKRILNLAAALAAVAAVAAVCVVAASFALYALAREYIGPAGGAAVVAAVFALVAVILALIATRKVTPKVKPGVPPPPASPIDKVVAMAKEHPIVAVGAAAVAVTVMVRNPAMVTALVSAFLAGNSTPKPPK
jgi:uncharacterized membrane protein